MQKRQKFREQVGLVEGLCFILIAFFCCAGMAFYVHAKSQQGQATVAAEKSEPELPSLIDIQKRLNELEPDNPIKADGVYGPKTKEKWERVYCNEQAKKYFTKGENHGTELRQIQLRRNAENTE
jgi:hypothetical protein